MKDLTTTPTPVMPVLASQDGPSKPQVPDWRQLDFAADCLCVRSASAPDTANSVR